MKNVPAYLTALMIVVLPLLIAEFFGCSVSGSEFSPDDFSARSFFYRRSPFSGTVRTKRTNEDLDLYCGTITGDGHINVIKSTPKRWDLFQENVQYSNKLSSEFDARFLTHFLNYNSDQWTIANPEKAAILWPEVAKMAREGLYLYLPEIMIAAIPADPNDEENRSVERFKAEIKSKFAKGYRMAAKAAKAKDDGKESQWLKAAADCEGDSFGQQLLEASE